MIFPPDYATARQRFRDTAARLGWTCQAYAIGAAGQDGEDLAIDVATSPGADAGPRPCRLEVPVAVQVDVVDDFVHVRNYSGARRSDAWCTAQRDCAPPGGSEWTAPSYDEGDEKPERPRAAA
jgi:hypothetical protein